MKKILIIIVILIILGGGLYLFTHKGVTRHLLGRNPKASSSKTTNTY